MIGDDIEVIIVGVEGDTVKLGIQAPREVSVYRKEVYLTIQQANEEAAKSHVDTDLLKEILLRKDEK